MQTALAEKEYLGLKIIDTDTHLTEPHDLWLKRAPKKMRDRVPQVKMINGDTTWVIDGNISIGTGASATSSIRPDGSKPPGLGFTKWKIDQVHPSSYDTKERVAMMDKMGIWAQIVYPNILGFGGQRTAKVDAELRLLSVQLYNDGMAEIQSDSGGRICPMALLPWWNVKEAVAECERIAGMGLRGVNINTDPQYHKSDEDGSTLPDLGHRHWDPMWEACVALNLPVNFHIGASEHTVDFKGTIGWPSLGEDMKSGLQGTMLFFNNARVLGNIIYSGLLDRYPKLKFVSVESGLGWIPFLLDSIDYQYREIVEGKSLQRKPSEYFRSNFHACFWFERDGLADIIRKVGIDNVLFETDFPHPTCLYPTTKDTFDLPGLTLAEKTKVLSTNASKVYGIPVD